MPLTLFPLVIPLGPQAALQPFPALVWAPLLSQLFFGFARAGKYWSTPPSYLFCAFPFFFDPCANRSCRYSFHLQTFSSARLQALLFFLLTCSSFLRSVFFIRNVAGFGCQQLRQDTKSSCLGPICPAPRFAKLGFSCGRSYNTFFPARALNVGKSDAPCYG